MAQPDWKPVTILHYLIVKGNKDETVSVMDGRTARKETYSLSLLRTLAQQNGGRVPKWPAERQWAAWALKAFLNPDLLKKAEEVQGGD